LWYTLNYPDEKIFWKNDSLLLKNSNNGNYVNIHWHIHSKINNFNLKNIKHINVSLENYLYQFEWKK